MAMGDFVWCDLSTFRPDTTARFYRALFGWQFDEITQPDGTPYLIGSAAGREAAGLYEMPEKFQQIGMPSFWMTYIEVADAAATVELANANGAKVEFGPVPFGESASIALIRDPLGAGFTVYQGSDLAPRAAAAGDGHMVWNALYVSSVETVADFYQALFGWQISRERTAADLYAVSSPAGDIASIYEFDDAARGEYQFWGVHFGVADIAAASDQVRQEGGEIVDEHEAQSGPTVLARDPDGAAFFMVEPG